MKQREPLPTGNSFPGGNGWIWPDCQMWQKFLPGPQRFFKGLITLSLIIKPQRREGDAQKVGFGCTGVTFPCPKSLSLFLLGTERPLLKCECGKQEFGILRLGLDSSAQYWILGSLGGLQVRCLSCLEPGCALWNSILFLG